MTSAITPSKPQQQTQQMSPPHHSHHHSHNNPASPPSKRDLKSWWKSFQTRAKHQDSQGKADRTSIPKACQLVCILLRAITRFRSARDARVFTNMATQTEPQHKGIFGVPLRQSITYANVAISLIDEKGESYIYGYVPIVVAKCGVFLKEKGW